MHYEINNKYVAMFLKAGFWLQGEVGEKKIPTFQQWGKTHVHKEQIPHPKSHTLQGEGLLCSLLLESDDNPIPQRSL